MILLTKAVLAVRSTRWLHQPKQWYYQRTPSKTPRLPATSREHVVVGLTRWNSLQAKTKCVNSLLFWKVLEQFASGSPWNFVQGTSI